MISNSEGVSGNWGRNYNFFCSITKKFDKQGTWKFALSIGYVNKTWDGSQWQIEEGIEKTEVHEIIVSGVTMPPETSSTILQRLLQKFLQSF